MNKKKLLKISVIITAIAILIGIVFGYAPFKTPASYKINLITSSDVSVGDSYKIYYLTDADTKEDSFSEEQTVYVDIVPNQQNELEFSLPGNVREIRLDLGVHQGTISIESLSISSGNTESNISFDVFTLYSMVSGVESVENKDGIIVIKSNSEDPYMVWNMETLIDKGDIEDDLITKNFLAKVCACFIDILLLLCFLKKYDELVEFPVQIYQSKKLILQLSKNDFKTKYAGSYLGIIWAFVQPIVTVLVYWFVFDVGLRSGSVMDAPFVLWLLAGLVPWFFFSDAWNGGTNALIEYQYLVKKVVFQIDILPLVKVISAMFVHVFFLVFTIILHACYGYGPDIYTLQLIYYSLCVFVLALGLSYITSAIVGFFKDLTQIIGIILQVGVWMTPIMWNMESMDMPGWLTFILKLNPMYYVVTGYRNTLINKVWFWEETTLTMYFWAIALFILGLGALVFKKLKVHFADVL